MDEDQAASAAVQAVAVPPEVNQALLELTIAAKDEVTKKILAELGKRFGDRYAAIGVAVCINIDARFHPRAEPVAQAEHQAGMAAMAQEPATPTKH